MSDDGRPVLSVVPRLFIRSVRDVGVGVMWWTTGQRVFYH